MLRNRLSLFRPLLMLASFLLSMTALAQAGYHVVQPQQPTDNPGKIEVIEFFYYACGHCKNLNKPLADWIAKQPGDVVVRRIPVSFGKGALANLAKMYYSLEATGDLAKLDEEIFKALHEERVNLASEPHMLEWLAKKGVNTQKFSELYKSFGVQSKVRRADQLAQAFKIEGVPAMAIEGKYLLDPNTPEKLFELADQLIKKERAERAKKK